jgi:hypothetical protein
LNPHLTMTVEWNGERCVERRATKSDWKKWRANEPTSAHWYDLARFERYMGAHIARDQDLGRKRTVREFISEFRGLSGSAKQKTVLDEVGATRSSLAGYFGNGEVDHAANAQLLAACQSTPGRSSRCPDRGHGRTLGDVNHAGNLAHFGVGLLVNFGKPDRV